MASGDPAIHTARVVVEGTREHGRGRATDGGALDVALAETGTTPEHLFGVAYGACLASAIASVARRQKVEPDDVSVAAAVSLVATEAGFSLAAELDVTLHGFDPSEAAATIRDALALCPYARTAATTLRANGIAV